MELEHFKKTLITFVISRRDTKNWIFLPVLGERIDGT